MENGKAKYYVIIEELKNKILEGVIKTGDRIPSENVLADTYHVSRHTVRKALSILGNEGYLVAEHGRGTFCAENGRKLGSSKNIAVITTYISDYIFPRLIQGIDHVLTANGYSIILKNTGNSQKNEAKALEDILTKNIDGLIIEPSKSEIFCKHIHHYETLDHLGIPYIFIQGNYPGMKKKPSILMDDEGGCYNLTKYLIDLGHKNIAGIFKVDDVQGNERHKGYIRAIQEAGMVYDPDKVILFHTEDRMKKPAAMIKSFVEQGITMDGVVCYNDQIAYDVIGALNQMKLSVPGDISVTGYDNSLIAGKALVKLTTVEHPKERLGAMAAELLLEKLKGIKEAESKVDRIIHAEIVIRDSCKRREVNTSVAFEK